MPDAALIWFRQDLRLSDNPVLAAVQGGPVLPVHVLEDGPGAPGGAVTFHHHDVRGSRMARKRLLALRFDAQTEISIYRSVPHTSPGKPQQLQVPLAMVRGRNSRVIMPHHGRLLSRVPQGEYLSMPGGHMFPLERPQDTAELLRGLFSRWSQTQDPV